MEYVLEVIKSKEYRDIFTIVLPFVFMVTTYCTYIEWKYKN